MNKHTLFIVAFFPILIFVTACGPGFFKSLDRHEPPTPTDQVASTIITLADTADEYSTTLNAIMKYVIETGQGYSVHILAVSSGELPELLRSGQVDLALAARQPDNFEWFDEAVERGELLDFGAAYEFGGHSYNSAGSLEFATKAPDLVRMLEKMIILHRRLEDTDDWHKEHQDLGTLRAAVYFMWNYDFEDNWKHWMPYHPAERIRRALDRFTGLRTGDPYKGREIERGNSGQSVGG